MKMADKDEENNRYLSDLEIDKLQVPKLKNYLREHQQNVSGNKSTLLLRAKGVRELDVVTVKDADVTFERRKVEKLVTPLGEKQPHPRELKDWRNDLSDVPMFSDDDIYNYFVLKMKTKKQLRAKVYYADRHVHGIFYHGIDDKCEHSFVKAKVILSLPCVIVKNNPDHDVWLCLSKVTGQVHSAECDCTAGSGEACNHIGALMYALADISTKKRDGTLASTSKKCVWDQFNNPRKRKLTPKRSSELKFRKYSHVSDLSATTEKKATRKVLFSSSVNEERFRAQLAVCNPSAGWLLNFVDSRKEEEEVPQFIDIVFNYKDSVNLQSEDVQKSMAEVVNLLKLSKDECETIEHLTRGQGKNDVWLQERKTRITASNFGEVVTRKPEAPPEGTVKRMLYSNFSSRFVQWGLKHEPAARRKYVNNMRKSYPDVKVRQCGLLVSCATPYLGASPDGLINYTDNGQHMSGVLEVKCPASDKWRRIAPSECAKDPDFYCCLNPETGACTLKTSHKYYYQVQGQMALSGKKWCDFVVWTLGGFSVERITFNEEHWSTMLAKLRDFYQSALVVELFSRRVQRGLKLF